MQQVWNRIAVGNELNAEVTESNAVVTDSNAAVTKSNSVGT